MRFLYLFISLFVFASCTTFPASETASKITKAEAQQYACPAHILATGATTQDCECVAAKLYTLGQDEGLLASQESSVPAAFETEKSARAIAIGLIRLEAFEMCGFFEPGHVVNETLGKPK